MRNSNKISLIASALLFSFTLLAFAESELPNGPLNSSTGMPNTNVPNTVPTGTNTSIPKPDSDNLSTPNTSNLKNPSNYNNNNTSDID